MAAGMFYWLAPRLWDRPLFSKKAADAHFWLATIGIILYMVSMWVSGVNQGLMWRAINPDGSLTYPSFTETLLAIRPMYIVRALGGTLYFVGFLLMIWNLLKTIMPAKAVDVSLEVTVVDHVTPGEENVTVATVLTGRPLWFSIVGFALMGVFFIVDNAFLAVALAVGTIVVGEIGYVFNKRERAAGKPSWFSIIEKRPFAFTVLVLISVLVGGVAELVPTVLMRQQAVPASGKPQLPYTPLEQQGRDLYTREGCYVCHSQMVRPMIAEYLRYGEASRAEEFIYDHPFQWGSKRTGPDLHREGLLRPTTQWHYTHLMDPRETSPGSNMPAYTWLKEGKIDEQLVTKKLEAMRTLGVPYTDQDLANAELNQHRQANTIVAELKAAKINVEWNSEIVALIAYLRRLGIDQGVPYSDAPVVSP
jgi:cytochrome c oxidase cbb3-type subunit I/II